MRAYVRATRLPAGFCRFLHALVRAPLAKKRSVDASRLRPARARENEQVDQRARLHDDGKTAAAIFTKRAMPKCDDHRCGRCRRRRRAT